MNLINIVRYHLRNRPNFAAIAWGALALSLAINLTIFAFVPKGEPHQTGGLATIYVFAFLIGLVTITQMLPFGLTLGLSRRSYFLGTALLAVLLSAVNGLALTVLTVIERASDGWGMQLHFFRVPLILDGPWYQTWLASFVGQALMFAYGLWYGLVYRRWNLFGVIAFVAVQTIVVFVAALVTTWTHTWHQVGHFFDVLSTVGLIGVLALVAAVLFTGGFTTMRRVTV